jgi:SAM-dependent methyltransferase
MALTVERVRSAVATRLPTSVRRRFPGTRQGGKIKLDAWSMAERWDREWITYFRRGPYFFVDCSEPNDETRRDVEQVRAALRRGGDSPVAPVSAANPVWDIWGIACLPEEIADRDVADLGCGPGQLGRRISYVTRTYLGIDYSPLALRVAQLVSPTQAEFVVRADTDTLAQRRGSVDTAFSRHVFIHQNFQQAVELAQVAADLLRGGGILAVDFHRPEVDDKGEFLKPPWLAKGDLDPEHPSRGFYFTDDEIADVGRAARLTLEEIIDAPERDWRIARYRKPSS